MLKGFLLNAPAVPAPVSAAGISTVHVSVQQQHPTQTTGQQPAAHHELPRVESFAAPVVVSPVATAAPSTAGKSGFDAFESLDAPAPISLLTQSTLIAPTAAVPSAVVPVAALAGQPQYPSAAPAHHVSPHHSTAPVAASSNSRGGTLNYSENDEV